MKKEGKKIVEGILFPKNEKVSLTTNENGQQTAVIVGKPEYGEYTVLYSSNDKLLKDRKHSTNDFQELFPMAKIFFDGDDVKLDSEAKSYITPK